MYPVQVTPHAPQRYARSTATVTSSRSALLWTSALNSVGPQPLLSHCAVTLSSLPWSCGKCLHFDVVVVVVFVVVVDVVVLPQTGPPPHSVYIIIRLRLCCKLSWTGVQHCPSVLTHVVVDLTVVGERL